MGERTEAVRSVWEDRFARPGVSDLVAGVLGGGCGALVGMVREALVGKGLVETASWHGLPWRWTLVYREAGAGEGSVAWAYVVPNPEKPVVCVPLTVECLEGMAVRKLKRYVRDGVVHARQVGGVYWPSWELTQASQAEELVDLVARKWRASGGGKSGVGGGVGGGVAGSGEGSDEAEAVGSR